MTTRTDEEEERYRHAMGFGWFLPATGHRYDLPPLDTLQSTRTAPPPAPAPRKAPTPCGTT